MDIKQRAQVAERIKSARQARGWSQERLAKEAGVAENTIVGLELGTRQTQQGKLSAVLDALELAAAPTSVIGLAEVPADAQRFLRVAAKRLAAMDAESRYRFMSLVYPILLEFDENGDRP